MTNVEIIMELLVVYWFNQKCEQHLFSQEILFIFRYLNFAEVVNSLFSLLSQTNILMTSIDMLLHLTFHKVSTLNALFFKIN